MKFGNLVEICLWPHLAVKGLKLTKTESDSENISLREVAKIYRDVYMVVDKFVPPPSVKFRDFGKLYSCVSAGPRIVQAICIVRHVRSSIQKV